MSIFCKFKGVDLQTSFPLSRFGLNKESVQIDFAVGGADEMTSVSGHP